MTKLCPRGKAAAKRKFKVYPSAYANAYASKICAGKIKDPSGVKRKDFKGPKPMSIGGKVMKAKRGKLVPLKKDPTKPISSVKPSVGGKGSGTTNLGNPRKKGDPFLERRFKLAGAKSLIGKGGRIGAAAALLGLAGAGAASLGQKIGKKLDEAKKKNKKMGGGMMKRPGYKKGKAIMILIGIGKKKPVKKAAVGAMMVGKKMIDDKTAGNAAMQMKKRLMGKKIGGVATTAGAQSGMGRLEKSGMKMSKGGLSDYYKDLM